MAVWIIDSPANVAVAKDIWGKQPQPQHMITTFKPDSFEGLMENIELHHGQFSQSPPFHILEVIGLTSNTDVQMVLSEYGFELTTATDDGFTASRVRDAATSEGELS